MSADVKTDTAPPEMPGDYLRRERESRLLSVAAVAKALKIDSSRIHSLEQNDCSAFSRKKDIPDLLRRYAKFLLIDADDLIRRFEAQPTAAYSCSPGEDVARAVLEHSRIRPDSPTGFGDGQRSALARRGFWLAAFGLVIAVSLLFFGRYVFSPGEPVTVLKDELRQAEKTVESLIEEPPAPPVNEAPPAPREKVIGNSDSRRYHLPEMKYYHAVDAYHRVEFDSEEEAIAAGYHKAPR